MPPATGWRAEPTRFLAENRLRPDLFARLRVHTLEIPPSRERREDFPALLAFLAGGVVRVDPFALTALLLHDHPHSLLETGPIVRFRVVDTHTELSPDKENIFVRAELVFEDNGTDPEEIVEWAAFRCPFTLAVLSFHDARRRGISEIEYQPNDEFTVADFFDCLSYKHDELGLETDYIRGRSMKTEVTIREDRSVTLTTRGAEVRAPCGG